MTMILRDVDLYNWLASNEVIDPLFDHKVRKNAAGDPIISKGLSQSGYDVSLSDKIRILKPRCFVDKLLRKRVIDPHNINRDDWKDITVKDYYDISPHSFVLATTCEFINMPNDAIAIVLGKSTYARDAIITNFTPLEAGWRGHITIEISNMTDSFNRIYVGQGIAQIVFFQLSGPVRASYNGAYQDQDETPRNALIGTEAQKIRASV